MLKKYLLQLKTYHRQAWREQKGQSLIIFVFAILALIAMMGLALDLGLVYIERVRVSRTTDAAALASVIELPFEEEAIRRAIEYIELNGYQPGIDTEIKVRGCIVVHEDINDPTSPLVLRNVNETGVLGESATMTPQPPSNRFNQGFSYPGTATPPEDDHIATFVIDTLAYQPAFDLDDNGSIDTANNTACTGTMADPQAALFGTANKLRVSGEVRVQMNFMRFFGWDTFPVVDEAVGENVTNLDVMIAFDVSGSMDYETNCFGCWNEGRPDLTPSPLPSADNPDPLLYPFPKNGLSNPIRYPDSNTIPAWGGGSIINDLGDAGDPVCDGDAATGYVDSPPYRYSVHEAEFYSDAGIGNTSVIQPWRFDNPLRQPGQGFWVLQRPVSGVGASNNAFMRAHSFVTYSQRDLSAIPQLQGGTYNPECFSGNGLSGTCWEATSPSLTPPEPASNNTPPWLEYDFTVNWSEPTHIWIRAIGGHGRDVKWSGQTKQLDVNDDWQKALFYQIIDYSADPVVKGTIDGRTLDGLLRQRGANIRFLEPGLVDNSHPPDEGDTDRWRWVRITQDTGLNLPDGAKRTLRIYQGSTGFNLDKIIITNDKEGGFGSGVTIGHGGYEFRVDGAEGPDATAGSATREACNMCNPMYGLDITDGANQCSCKTDFNDTDSNALPGLAIGEAFNCSAVITETNTLLNDLYHDKDPLRSAQEAVKNFAARLDPKFDQLGVVAFDDALFDRVKLQCLRDEQDGPLGPRGCYDTASGDSHPERLAVGATGPITFARVIKAVEDYNPGGQTDISEGMEAGLQELGLSVGDDVVGHGCDPGDPFQACDRQGAARRVLIVMTDGAPNQSVTGPCRRDGEKAVWRGLVGTDTDPYNCAMYYAREAAKNNVVVYTIGIGPGVDRTLLTAMAEGEVTIPNPEESCGPDNNNGHPCGDDGFYFEGIGGKFFPAVSPKDLDGIFEQILDNIYVRIIG